jgi:hypothetical protein
MRRIIIRALHWELFGRCYEGGQNEQDMSHSLERKKLHTLLRHDACHRNREWRHSVFRSWRLCFQFRRRQAFIPHKLCISVGEHGIFWNITFFFWKPEWQIPSGRPRRLWEANVNIDFEEVGLEGVVYIRFICLRIGSSTSLLWER